MGTRQTGHPRGVATVQLFWGDWTNPLDTVAPPVSGGSGMTGKPRFQRALIDENHGFACQQNTICPCSLLRKKDPLGGKIVIIHSLEEKVETLKIVVPDWKLLVNRCLSQDVPWLLGGSGSARRL